MVLSALFRSALDKIANAVWRRQLKMLRVCSFKQMPGRWAARHRNRLGWQPESEERADASSSVVPTEDSGGLAC